MSAGKLQQLVNGWVEAYFNTVHGSEATARLHNGRWAKMGCVTCLQDNKNLGLAWTKIIGYRGHQTSPKGGVRALSRKIGAARQHCRHRFVRASVKVLAACRSLKGSPYCIGNRAHVPRVHNMQLCWQVLQLMVVAWGILQIYYRPLTEQDRVFALRQRTKEDEEGEHAKAPHVDCRRCLH